MGRRVASVYTLSSVRIFVVFGDGRWTFNKSAVAENIKAARVRYLYTDREPEYTFGQGT